MHGMGESRKIQTAAGVEHTFQLQAPTVKEIRYQLESDIDFWGKEHWITVGNDKERAENSTIFNEYQYAIGSNFAIPLQEYEEFPVKVHFEIFTDQGWVKPSGDQTPDGVGTFDSFSAQVVINQDGVKRTVSLQYPWANSVRLTFPDRGHYHYITVGPDKEYAEKDDAYFYAAPGSTFEIDMDEGDFFPFNVQFAPRDDKGVLHESETFTFTKNEPSELYEKGGYKFTAHSYWMDTVRVHLPERTFSVGTGTNLPEGWLEKHPNYRLYGQEHQEKGFPIPLRTGDTFPLEVEFMSRTVKEAPKPEKVTFTALSDTKTFGGFNFRLDSDYTDTVRYIVAYGESVADEKGVLYPKYENQWVTVVHDTVWAANHKDEGYAAFDKDGNFTIPLGADGALPVDVWFALPDENGSFAGSAYKKVTFTGRDSSTLMPEKKEDGTPDTIPHHTFTVGADWMDEVTYTLPQVPRNASLPEPKPVTVGIDKDRAKAESEVAQKERREPLYVIYDEDGSYTIELEEDAFFPYVVNVSYRLPERTEYLENAIGKDGAPQRDRNGNEIKVNNPYKGELQYKDGQIEFASPDAMVQMNGHIFKVHSQRRNPRAAVRITLKLGEHEIPLRLTGMPGSPALPAVDSKDGAQLLSTQALTEVQLYANLTGAFNLELADAHVQVYMWNFDRNEEELAKEFVWGEWQMENYDDATNTWKTDNETVKYQILGTGENDKKLDLSGYASTEAQEQYFEVITGTLDQLDLENIRYVIKTDLKYPQYDSLLRMKVAYMDDRRGGVYILDERYQHFPEDYNFPYQPPGLTTVGADAYTYETEDGVSHRVDVYRFTVDETWQDSRLWMTMKRDETANDYPAFRDLDAEIYEGFYFSAEEAEASGKNIITGSAKADGEMGRTISSVVWEQELNTQRIAERYAYPSAFVNGPAGIEKGPRFTIVWKRNGTPVAIMPFRILVDVKTTVRTDEAGNLVEDPVPITFLPPHTYNDFIPDENGNYPDNTYLERISEILDSGTGILSSYYWTATQGSLYDDRYYVEAQYNLNGGDWKGDKIKVYAASEKYATLDEAKAASERNDSSRAMDVTEQVFKRGVGFGADYSKDYSSGVVFSVFDENGDLLLCRKIQTLRREFLHFGTLKGLDFVLESNSTLQNSPYDENVVYNLPDSEYRGIYNGRAQYTIPVAYLRDYVPSSFKDYGVKIVAGNKRYETYDAAIKNTDGMMEDITNLVTSGTVYSQTAEVIQYRAAYRNGIHFNLYGADGKLLDHRLVTAVEPGRVGDTYFEATGAKSTRGTDYLAYRMPGNMDGYHSHGYQTIFLLNRDKTPVEADEIIPVFDFHEEDRARAFKILVKREKIC